MGLQNMRHVISIRDVVSDTVHQFAPTYHDYVLYSNGNSKVSQHAVMGRGNDLGCTSCTHAGVHDTQT